MEQKKTPRRPVKVQVRQSPRLLKILLALLIVFSMGALMALRWVSMEIRSETEKMLAQAAKLQYDNSELSRLTEAVGTVRGIAEIALRELGLADPNTVLINPS